MKLFIVSTALIIAGVSALVFSSDMNIYLNTRVHLKALDESCALCGALSAVEGEDGAISFDAASGFCDMRNYLDAASFAMPCFSHGRIYIDEDSEKSFFDDGSELKSVRVTLIYSPDRDIFRLPFISCFSMSHQSCYEWVPVSR